MPGKKNDNNEELGRKRQERKTAQKEVIRRERSESEFRSCVKVEVAVLGFPS